MSEVSRQSRLHTVGIPARRSARWAQAARLARRARSVAAESAPAVQWSGAIWRPLRLARMRDTGVWR